MYKRNKYEGNKEVFKEEFSGFTLTILAVYYNNVAIDPYEMDIREHVISFTEVLEHKEEKYFYLRHGVTSISKDKYVLSPDLLAYSGIAPKGGTVRTIDEAYTEKVKEIRLKLKELATYKEADFVLSKMTRNLPTVPLEKLN